MSRTRKLKKAAKGRSAVARVDRVFDKRASRDPFFLVGQMDIPAPIKYSRCPICIGGPHYSPWLLGGLS